MSVSVFKKYDFLLHPPVGWGGGSVYKYYYLLGVEQIRIKRFAKHHTPMGHRYGREVNLQNIYF